MLSSDEEKYLCVKPSVQGIPGDKPAIHTSESEKCQSFFFCVVQHICNRRHKGGPHTKPLNHPGCIKNKLIERERLILQFILLNFICSKLYSF